MTDDVKNSVSAYYEFVVRNNTIQKRSLLEKEPDNPPTNMSIWQFAIHDAEDLKNYNFACY